MTPTLDASDSEYWKEPDNIGDTRWEDKSNIQGGETDAYPTGWREVDTLSSIEVRQVSFDTYQLRSPSHVILINSEGFKLFRDNTAAGQVIWNDWLKRNNIQSTPRDTTTEVDNAES